MGIKTLRIGTIVSLRQSLVVAAAFLLIILNAPRTDAREPVSWEGDHDMSTIVIKTSKRKLYYILGEGIALRDDVAVGTRPMRRLLLAVPYRADVFGCGTVRSKICSNGYTPGHQSM
jgi:hypothetical protein